MQLSDLVTSVQGKGYSFSNAITDPANPIVIALNSAYRNILGNQRWPFLEKQNRAITMVVGTDTYAMSTIADLTQVDAIRIENDATNEFYDLENKEQQEFRDFQHIDRQVDKPLYWSMVANNFVFWPVPDLPYMVVVDYIYKPPDLAVATDVPVLPLVYHDVIVWGAVMELAFRERDWLGRNFAEGMYQQKYKQMEEEYLLRQRQTSSHVKSSGYWDSYVPSWSYVNWGN